MNWIISNWYIIAALLVLICYGVYSILKFNQLSKDSKEEIINKWKDKIIKWLIGACIEAEKELKTKTGILKLTRVYENFVKIFPWLVEILSFQIFSSWVDEALIEVRRILETNKNISNYVYGESDKLNELEKAIFNK